jgi:glycerol transport system ATP-binding protein
MLGGNTATLSQGRITQFGPTIDVYRRPADLTTAKTFADPPLNFIDMIKEGGAFRHRDTDTLPVPAHLSTIGDGPVTVAFHPHHLGLRQQTADAARLSARTQISEITGSESFVHLDYDGVKWVMLAPGIHDIDPDTGVDVFLDTRHLMAFGSDGRAIAAAAA